MPELADGPDLGSGAAMRGGSSPPFPTIRNSSRTICPSYNGERGIKLRPRYLSILHVKTFQDGLAQQALLKFFKGASCSYLLLEGTTARRGILNPDRPDLLDLLTYSGHNQWPCIHNKSRVYSRSQYVDIIYLSYLINVNSTNNLNVWSLSGILDYTASNRATTVQYCSNLFCHILF